MTANNFRYYFMPKYTGHKKVAYTFRNDSSGLLMLCEADDTEWFGQICTTPTGKKYGI